VFFLIKHEKMLYILGVDLIKPTNAELLIIYPFYKEHLFQIKYNVDNKLCAYFRTPALDICLITSVDDSSIRFCLNMKQTYICMC
jgi:hypothetical protein